MNHKKAKNESTAWDMQEQYTDKPHGWVQWKGTAVCMDVYCACGHHSHIDAEFAYHVKCPECGRVYFCNGHIELIELEEEPDTCVVMEGQEEPPEVVFEAVQFDKSNILKELENKISFFDSDK